ncbi:hypothetical protein K491DRAFT_33416 [Lophiostoma macrostomum CBS 122681]|uniref:F-box domain-containing protein n=1 Tax=Lophiostoma macrostomum CBS 122681 TaxID=1314788 RepID=A0A6A6SYQ5_9PLEO|nr:hypothetical protein K491DRAFT_33416 [Lophiostoma macrostomum CBS 122681]
MLTFSDLPLEIVLLVADYLSADSFLALRLTAKSLYENDRLTNLPRFQKVVLSKCERLRVRLYLKRCPSPWQKYCFACERHVSLANFKSPTGAACIPRDSGAEVVELPPGICSYHIPRLTLTTHIASGGTNKWISRVKYLCMHCRQVRGWRCSCRDICQSCGTLLVRTYERYLSGHSQVNSFRFCRDDSLSSISPFDKLGGRLYVREPQLVAGSSRAVYYLVQFPVFPPPTF